MAKPYKYILYSIILIYLHNIVIIIQIFTGENLPLIRYSFILGSFFFLAYGIKKTQIHFSNINAGINVFIILFLVWNFFIVFRGFPAIIKGENNFILLKQFISYNIMIYSIPFLLLIKPNLIFLKAILKLSLILSAVYIIITLPFFNYFSSNRNNNGESYAVWLAAGISLVYLTRPYHSKTVGWISGFTILLALFIVSILARRNQVVYFVSVLFFSIIIPLIFNSQIIKYQKLKYFINSFLVIILIIIVVFINYSKFSFLEKKIKTGMQSREKFIKEYVSDLNSRPKDWVFGRGMNGTFKTKIPELKQGYFDRELIENGYLYHVLKGGFIYVILLILIFIKAIWNGFFNSQNILCKACASILVVYLIDMIGYGLPSLSLKYFIIWLSVGICLSEEIRNYSDIQLKNYIGLKKI